MRALTPTNVKVTARWNARSKSRKQTTSSHAKHASKQTVANAIANTAQYITNDFIDS